jgi:hypothetical protein
MVLIAQCWGKGGSKGPASDVRPRLRPLCDTAGHCGAVSAAGQEFDARVLG